MFLINIAPIWWDLIILAILVIGILIGMLLGLQATLFLLVGNLVSIVLALAFKSLILPLLITDLQGILVNSSQPNFVPIIVHNLAPTLYYAIWVIGINFLLGIVYVILKLTLLRHHKSKSKAISICGGALINCFRYTFLTGFMALLIGSGLIANRTTAINDYYQNDIPSQSIAYRFFHQIYPNYPLFEISNDDLQSAADLKNYAVGIQYVTNEFEEAINAAKTSDFSQLDPAYNDFNTYFPFTETEATTIKTAIVKIKNHDVSSLDQMQLIGTMIKQRIGLDWANVGFMRSKLIMIQDLLNLYPTTSNFFINTFSTAGSIDVKDSVVAPLFTELKPQLTTFLAKIPAGIEEDMKTALTDFYQGWSPTTQSKFK